MSHKPPNTYLALNPRCTSSRRTEWTYPLYSVSSWPPSALLIRTYRWSPLSTDGLFSARPGTWHVFKVQVVKKDTLWQSYIYTCNQFKHLHTMTMSLKYTGWPQSKSLWMANRWLPKILLDSQKHAWNTVTWNFIWLILKQK